MLKVTKINKRLFNALEGLKIRVAKKPTKILKSQADGFN